MNLFRLMDNGVSPPVIADALFSHFESMEQREIRSGCWPFQYAMICRDRSGDARMVVLFYGACNGWHYQAHSPAILKQLRLESRQ